ncbi:hypothetical protein GCM10027275_17310 [Rhabdobacter roseus]|uniref:Ppx/GppA phosphatase domain-containing protein n=1 Tax=Rhabdobacter roseus TaxID=1655419 RepID=A0A840TL41_9BACT|nr:hypothetical protein [Rhabdobacter roseus]MBB5283655.1 hypothetical protein [Rhabdobacter roseus]
MKRLTVAGRLLITVLILGALFAGYKYLGGEQALEKIATTAQNSSTTAETSVAERSEADGSESTSAPDNQATDTRSGSFNYTAPAPVNGTLKGVVELGASGFNSFIVRIDNQKRWKLEKAEFGNSLVLENMATDDDVRMGLKRYIGSMLDFGVSGKEIHFVVSSGAAKADVTQKISRALKSLGYVVNQVTPEQEGQLGLRSVLPEEYTSRAFVTDIGSGNTKISWLDGSKIKSVETYGAKYFQAGPDDKTVYNEVAAKAKQIPASQRKTCFIIGGVPFEMAKEVRQGKERYTVLKAPDAYQLENAKSKAGVNIYKAIAEATGCEQFVFDWDANFTIGFLLSL